MVRLFIHRLIGMIACLCYMTFAGPACAGPDDTMAQRAKPCMACHGDEGRAAPDGYYPRIAGKPAGYLLHQLQSFRDGSRPNPAMAYLLYGMPDRYLQEFADYFAGQHPPYQAAAPIRLDAALEAEGKVLVMQGDAQHGIPACADCHGVDLAGRPPDIPGLLGVPRTYLTSQLGAWRVGLRRAKDPDCMAQIAKKLNARQLDAAIAWISVQLPNSLAPAPTASLGVKLPLTCGSVDRQGIAP